MGLLKWKARLLAAYEEKLELEVQHAVLEADLAGLRALYKDATMKKKKAEEKEDKGPAQTDSS